MCLQKQCLRKIPAQLFAATTSSLSEWRPQLTVCWVHSRKSTPPPCCRHPVFHTSCFWIWYLQCTFKWGNMTTKRRRDDKSLLLHLSHIQRYTSFGWTHSNSKTQMNFQCLIWNLQPLWNLSSLLKLKVLHTQTWGNKGIRIRIKCLWKMKTHLSYLVPITFWPCGRNGIFKSLKRFHSICLELFSLWMLYQPSYIIYLLSFCSLYGFY